MSVRGDHCPECDRPLYESRFDTTFRYPDGSERICLDLIGGLCQPCNQLYVDPEAIDMLDLRRGRCVFAIESETVLSRRTAGFTD
jgi:hypothetical protein